MTEKSYFFPSDFESGKGTIGIRLNLLPPSCSFNAQTRLFELQIHSIEAAKAIHFELSTRIAEWENHNAALITPQNQQPKSE
ncbi:MAG: hypothetical protein F9K23_17365 [Bacteroidetes bacterium]|nr:MAG: hypothetical protein F9K23_17365 [Bacteroidota bacterium]